MNDKDLIKKLSMITNEEIEKEASRLIDDGIPKELIKPLWEDEMLKEQIANTTDEDRERFRKSFELTLEMLNEEMENSVKRKKRLMRLEKEMLVDMVFNLERRNEFLLHNLSEVEKMYNKLKDRKPVGEWIYEDKVAGMRYYRCTNCTSGYETLADENEAKWWRFCPRCGSKMFTKEEKKND